MSHHQHDNHAHEEHNHHGLLHLLHHEHPQEEKKPEEHHEALLEHLYHLLKEVHLEVPRILVPHEDSGRIVLFFLLFSLALIVTGLFLAPIETLFSGFGTLLLSPCKLLTDVCVIAGENVAFVNAGLVGILACCLYHFTGAKLTGLHIGTFFHAVGIAFYGKNILNYWPLITGVYLYARVKKGPFKNHLPTALFSGALSGCVSEIAFNDYLGLPLYVSIPIASLVGLLMGFLIVPLAKHTLRMHKSYNLFNMGLAAGLEGVLFYTIYNTCVLSPLGLSGQVGLHGYLLETNSKPLLWFFLIYFVYTIFQGFWLNGKSFRGYLSLVNTHGYKEDYLAEFGLPLVMINYGVLGLLSMGYFLLVGGPVTGLTVGALLCLLCWCGLGSTPKNLLPIMLGYALVSLFASWDLGTQTICIGLCFATGLCPIAGRYGFLAGLAAGALHACLVTSTAAFHGGFNLYNGGFTSGLVACVLVPFLEACFKAKENPANMLAFQKSTIPHPVPEAVQAKAGEGKPISQEG